MKQPNREKSKEQIEVEAASDALTTTTYMPRKSELRQLKQLAVKADTSNSLLVRYALHKTFGIDVDSRVTDIGSKFRAQS